MKRDRNQLMLYYRVLHSPEHMADWHEERFFSYHNLLPGEWIDLFYKEKCHDAEKYPLRTNLGQFTQLALEQFLNLAPHYRQGDIWSADDLKKASQLDGICAFQDAESALDYMSGSHYGSICVVSFEGYFVSTIPETSGTMRGALVKHIRTVSIQTAEAFKCSLRST